MEPAHDRTAELATLLNRALSFVGVATEGVEPEVHAQLRRIGVRSCASAIYQRSAGWQYRVVLFAGAQVLVEKERFHDVYVLLPT